MQNTMPCSKCGAMNLVGERFCAGCGTRLHYSCPNCGADVDNRTLNCPKCLRPLDWPTMKPGQLRRLARRAKAHQESAGTTKPVTGEKAPKKQSPWSLGCLIPVCVLLLVTGVIVSVLLLG